jgi:hypothetical protein
MAAKFEGIRLGKKTIEHSRASHPLTGVVARLETGGQVRERVDVDDVRLLSGLRAQLLKEGVHDAEPYLTVSGPGFEWAVPITASQIPRAREFAIKVNAASVPDPDL